MTEETQKQIKTLQEEIIDCPRCERRSDYDLCGECLERQYSIEKLKGN